MVAEGLQVANDPAKKNWAADGAIRGSGQAGHVPVVMSPDLVRHGQKKRRRQADWPAGAVGFC
jgi:hypothetical protein